MPTDIFKLHAQMTGHLFPAFSSEDERFLALALCGEAGELANLIKKRWRDGAYLADEIREELADIRVYLELLARCFGIEGEKLDREVEKKLVKVAARHKDRIDSDPLLYCSHGNVLIDGAGERLKPTCGCEE
jgi:NTP pyrophosphatase (non-canonical NTP hydrolase)